MLTGHSIPPMNGTPVCRRPRRLGNQARAALTGEVRPKPLGFDLQSILQLGKRGHVDECPYQPRQESAHVKTTGLQDRKVLADHGHIALVKISERTPRVPSLEPFANQPPHITPLLDRCLGDAGHGASVLHDRRGIADDEYAGYIWNLQARTNGYATGPIDLGAEHFHDR